MRKNSRRVGARFPMILRRRGRKFEKVHETLRPPEDWRTREPKAEEVAGFQKQVREAAESFANKAREFIERFPTNENVGDARITVVHALTHAVAAGDADAEKQIATYVAGVLADKASRKTTAPGFCCMLAMPRS